MTTFFILLVVFLFINLIISKKRIIQVNRLHTLYDKLELEVIKQDLVPDKKLITFLKIHKTPIYHNHKLDFFVMFKNIKKLEEDKDYDKRKEGFKKYLDSLPKEIRDISNEINDKQNSVINLSLLKPFNFIFISFILFISITGILIYSIFKLFGVILSGLIETPKLVKELYESESIIVSYRETKLYS